MAEALDAALDAAFAQGNGSGYHAQVWKGEQKLHEHSVGAVDGGTICRLASMSKAITSVAALRLLERGQHFALTDALEHLLPEFADMEVLEPDGAGGWTTRPARGQILIHHLLTHTAGLSYGFIGAMQPWDAAAVELSRRYAEAGVGAFTQRGRSLEDHVRRIAGLPLLFDPGSAYTYSVGTDVLGRLLEVCAGASLADVLAAEVLEPLGMADTGFSVPADKEARFAAMHAVERPGGAQAVERPAEPYSSFGVTFTPDAPLESHAPEEPWCYSGGGGLVGTADDYAKFVRMLARGGAPLLREATLRWASRNHIGGHDHAMLNGWKHGLFSAVCPAEGATTVAGRTGQLRWGGAFGTAWLVDPETGLAAVFMQQGWPRAADMWFRFYSLVLGAESWDA